MASIPKRRVTDAEDMMPVADKRIGPIVDYAKIAQLLIEGTDDSIERASKLAGDDPGAMAMVAEYRKRR